MFFLSNQFYREHLNFIKNKHDHSKVVELAIATPKRKKLNLDKRMSASGPESRLGKKKKIHDAVWYSSTCDIDKTKAKS